MLCECLSAWLEQKAKRQSVHIQAADRGSSGSHASHVPSICGKSSSIKSQHPLDASMVVEDGDDSESLG